MSDRPVANMGPKGLFNYLGGEEEGAPNMFARLKHLFGMSIILSPLKDNASFTLPKS